MLVALICSVVTACKRIKMTIWKSVTLRMLSLTTLVKYVVADTERSLAQQHGHRQAGKKCRREGNNSEDEPCRRKIPDTDTSSRGLAGFGHQSALSMVCRNASLAKGIVYPPPGEIK